MSHNQFYIIEEVGGHDPEEGRKVLLTTTQFEVGDTHKRTINPSTPATECKIIAGPFDLPESMPHALDVKRWMRSCRPELYAEYFDTGDK